MLAHGAAPYQNDPAEKMSYFVKLRTETGERTIWGKDLTELSASPNLIRAMLFAWSSRAISP